MLGKALVGLIIAGVIPSGADLQAKRGISRGTPPIPTGSTGPPADVRIYYFEQLSFH
jgi:hypothetical protein